MFNISIEQKVLMKALEYLEPTVGKNATGLGDNCVCMKTTGNGSIEMYTTNTLEFTKLEAIVAVGGNTQDIAPYVDFKRFKAIISSIPANEVVSLEASVNDILINFALKKTPIKLVGCNNGMIPLPTNQFPSVSVVTIPKTFIKQATDNVCSIVTDSVSTPIYNCMRIFTSGMGVEVTALDMSGKRTFVQSGTATGNNPQQEILLEASKFKKSLKLFEDYNELEFYMDQNMVRVDGTDPVQSYAQKTNGMIANISYFARRLTGAFPANIKANFTPMPTEFSELSKEEILNCFTRIKAIEDQTNGGIIGFEIDGSNAIITLNSAYGNIEDSIAAENSVSKTFKTQFKYENLSDIMKVIGTDTFEIGVLPNHPTNYVIKSKGNSDIMFTIPGMVGASATP
jgi:DNA polymerase III sliding clamp (beta) subunit (PCNA family)